jgi:broad specificity phosphatase PhoE
MVEIVFHSHASTADNEAGLASGHNDVALSSAGITEAKRLGKRYKKSTFDAIFCSDLQRSYETAELAFGTRFPIIKDACLRECDYGEFTLKPKGLVKEQRLQRISEPFPGGESYLQVISRMKRFLQDLATNYDSKRIMIIGHGGTRLGLEYWLNNVSLEEALAGLKKQQNGTTYRLTDLYWLRIDSQPLD